MPDPRNCHTPGPWHVQCMDLHFWFEGPNQEESALAEIMPRVPGKPPTAEDWQNALLMALVPEMFERLRRLVMDQRPAPRDIEYPRALEGGVRRHRRAMAVLRA